MPLVKHRDNLSDLIRKGGDKKTSHRAERVSHSKLIIKNAAVTGSDGTVLRTEEEISPLLRLSSIFLYLVELPFLKVTRFIAIVMAVAIVISETSGKVESPELELATNTLEYIVDIYYLFDGGAKLLSLYSYVEIENNHLYQKITNVTYLRRSGVLDLSLAVLCLTYFDTRAISRWLHLLRCASFSLFYLEQLPQIDVLSSGISAGLTSTLYTWLLMTVTFLVYSATAVIFFRDSDPYHFGDLSMAMYTYFEMSTLDNWGDVLNINYWGCDQYDAGYYVNGTRNDIIQTGFGSFYLPVCWKPQASPMSASLFFVSFILICGFILVSLTVAFVTTGINTRLHELQQEEDKEELKREMGSKKKIQFPSRKKKSNKSAAVSNSNANAEVFTSSNSMQSATSAKDAMQEVKNPELLRELLKQVWSGKGDIVKEDNVDTIQKFQIQREKSFLDKSSFRGLISPGKVGNTKRKAALNMHLLRFGLQMRQVTQSAMYNYIIYSIIILAAVLELLTIQLLISNRVANVISIGCQCVFTIDLFIKFSAHAPRYLLFIKNNWNVFDLVLVTCLWIPVGNNSDNSVFELLSVLRIIRVLKMLSFIRELNVIIQSIATSARCLCYVVMFMIVFFFHFGAAGVFLFKNNDPFHFENLGRAMLSLFQVSTLDNWGDVARMNIYGCKYVGYDPEQCDLEKSQGYGWLAAWYFVIFVIVGVMVLVALFIGVIITSMDLLHLSIHEEADMLKKVRLKQAEFSISDATCSTLLEIFDMIDVCANGRLTLNELKPVLSMVSIGENQQYELFHKIDEDASGKIDFAEFCELIKLMGEAYQQNNPPQLKDHVDKMRLLSRFGSLKNRVLPFGLSPKKPALQVLTSNLINKRGSNRSLKEDAAPMTGSPIAPSPAQTAAMKRKSMFLAAARSAKTTLEAQDGENVVPGDGAIVNSLGSRNTIENAEVAEIKAAASDVKDNSSVELGKADTVPDPVVPMLEAKIPSSSNISDRGNVASPEPAVTSSVGPMSSAEPNPIAVSPPKHLSPIAARINQIVPMNSSPSPSPRKLSDRLPSLKKSFEEIKQQLQKPPGEAKTPVENGIYSFELTSTDAVAAAASLLKFPSDDSLAQLKHSSSKYRQPQSNNKEQEFSKLKHMRKYRSGPMPSSSLAVEPKKPNLFFDYYAQGEEDQVAVADKKSKPGWS